MCIYDCMWNPTVRLLINRFLSYLILSYLTAEIMNIDNNINCIYISPPIVNIVQESRIRELIERLFSLAITVGRRYDFFI